MSEENKPISIDVSDEDLMILETTRRVRTKLIDKLTNGGEKLPDDKSDKALLVALMDGADKQVFTKAKIKAAEGANEALGSLTELATKVLLSRKHKVRAPRPYNELTEPEGVSFRPPAPGETDIGLKPLTLADIQEK